jgi:alkanesulfonate monooxygenase SsuD/methylene tetrahydromethanopterin reductase-like flavin-dependent oxidoreductase (luciferase family)
MQATAFFDALPAGSKQRLSMLRMGYIAANEADAREKIALAFANHQRFMNVFTTPGTVRHGEIVPIEVEDTPADLEQRLLIGTAQQVIDKLGSYAKLGIHDIQLNMNFGTGHADVMRSLERLSTQVMPHFAHR